MTLFEKREKGADRDFTKWFTVSTEI